MYGIEGLLAGRTLADRYRIEEVIGRGGMGAVYRARDLRLGREVAVKVISVAVADREAHERLRARFQREARVAANLHHPNVVAVYDYGTDPVLGLDFLVMELLRGEDLALRLSRKGPPAVPTALDILHQAARGLAAGHRAGLVHRDVKPGNLYLEPGDRVGEVHVRVLDFGIADIAAGDEQTVTHLTVAGRSPYSPAYASPEQVRGETRLSPATDVFSLGAVGFHLLTGRRAFSAADPRQMVVELSAALAAELPRVRGLPPGAREVLQRALAPDPQDRFPTAGELAVALEPLLRNAAGEGREDAADEGTLLDPEGPTRNGRASATRFAGPTAAGTRFQTPAPPAAPRPGDAGGLPDGGVRGASAAPISRSPPPLPRSGWLRRAARTTWDLLLTATSLALFAGAWFLAITGVQESDLQRVYGGAVVSVIATPFAVHRLMGARGSYRFALFGSIVGSLAVIYLLVHEQEAEVQTVLGAMFLAQIVICFLAELFTSRGEPRSARLPPDLRD